MILLIGLLALRFVFGKSSAGFLYSPTTNSFICNENTSKDAGSIPLRFVIEIPDIIEEKPEKNFQENFDVVNISGKPGNGNKISINQKGEVKLYKGNLCETAYETNLKAEICGRNYRQIFIWVPEMYFTEFVKILTDKAENQGENEIKSGDPLTEVKESLKDIKSLIKSKGKTPENLTGNCKGPVWQKNDENKRYVDLMLNTYMWAYCSSNPRPESCRSIKTTKKIKKHKKMCLQKNVCIGPNIDKHRDTVAPFSPGKIVDKIQSILNGAGLDSADFQPNESQKSQNRPRKHFGKGEKILDGINGPCKCVLECVRNPKNGMCFYYYTTDGNLKPIMKNERCCNRGKPQICDFNNIVEKYLCELNLKEDYGHSSKVFNNNFICN